MGVIDETFDRNYNKSINLLKLLATWDLTVIYH